MAITADVLLAVAIHPWTENQPSKIRIANINSKSFGSREFEIPANGRVTVDPSSHEWINYFKAGFKGVSELLSEKNPSFRAVGMDILVDGNVPAGGGLSSSSAFVCASALAVITANGQKMVDKTELCELAIVSERAVGTRSGGFVSQHVGVVPSELLTIKNPPTGWIRQLQSYLNKERHYTFHLHLSFVLPP
jgi:galactokinase